MGALRAPYMAKTDKERLATGFWNRIESNQVTDCNTVAKRASVQLQRQKLSISQKDGHCYVVPLINTSLCF